MCLYVYISHKKIVTIRRGMLGQMALLHVPQQHLSQDEGAVDLLRITFFKQTSTSHAILFVF